MYIKNRFPNGPPEIEQHSATQPAPLNASILGQKSIPPDAPLRLRVAACIAFPDGSMSASGLRREAVRGRLVIERVAGKDYTTLRNIEQMRELCRVQARGHGSTCVEQDRTSDERPSGSSATATNISPRDALQARLNTDRRKRRNVP